MPISRTSARTRRPIVATFDEAVTKFAFTYADRNDRDYAAFTAAIADGRIEVADG